MSDVNFRIVEQEDNYAEKYNDFVELYNKGVRTVDILEILSVGTKRYGTLLKEAVANGDVVKRDKKDYPLVVDLRNNGFSLNRIRRELGLTYPLLEKIRKKAILEGDIVK